MNMDVNFILSQIHEGQWFGWRKVDDEGNKIPNDQRMTLANCILTDYGTAQGYSIPSQSDVDAKETELEDAQAARASKKASGKQKLKDLGLDDDEIKALMGS